MSSGLLRLRFNSESNPFAQLLNCFHGSQIITKSQVMQKTTSHHRSSRIRSRYDIILLFQEPTL